MEKFTIGRTENSSESEKSFRIKKGSEAPEEEKNDPLYDEYSWGKFDREKNEMYLPESDEAMSFAIASRELGRMVKRESMPEEKGTEKVLKEESWMWQKGLGFLEKKLPLYYSDKMKIDTVGRIIFEIEEKMMEIAELSSSGSEEDRQKAKELIGGLRDLVHKKAESYEDPDVAKTADWGKFSEVIQACARDIEKYNRIEKGGLTMEEARIELGGSLEKKIKEYADDGVIGTGIDVHLPDTPGSFRCAVRIENGKLGEISVEEYTSIRNKMAEWDDLTPADKKTVLEKIEKEGEFM